MEERTANLNIPNEITDIWQQIVDSIALILSVPSVMINRLNPPILEVFRSSNNSGNPLPSGTKMEMAGVYCETTARQRSKLKVKNARKDPQWSDSPTAKVGIISYIGYPLFWPNGDIFGAICAVDIKENDWEKKYENIFQSFKKAIEVHLLLVETSENLKKRNAELELYINEIKTLRGLLPICSGCKKIRDDKGYWNQIERYITDNSGAKFTHCLCPECAKKLYGIDNAE